MGVTRASTPRAVSRFTSATASVRLLYAASCTDHFGAQCFGCHDEDARQGQPKTWAIDFGFAAEPVECAPCHSGDPRQYPSPCN